MANVSYFYFSALVISFFLIALAMATSPMNGDSKTSKMVAQV